jgi:hypothetical protein
MVLLVVPAEAGELVVWVLLVVKALEAGMARPTHLMFQTEVPRVGTLLHVVAKVVLEVKVEQVE